MGLGYTQAMAWEVEYTNEFQEWWYSLTPEQQGAVTRKVDLLMQHGPALGYPHSSNVKGSRHGAMRELRTQSRGRPIRVFYAFDPRRTSILLIGGDKTGNDRFYGEFVSLADALFDEHLTELRREGLIQ